MPRPAPAPLPLPAALAGVLCVLGAAAPASAQIDPRPCRAGEFVGCAHAPVLFAHREGLPREVDVDTGWQPPSGPVQVRFRAVLVGHTEVRLAGALEGGWPEPMQLSLRGTPQGGTLVTDWGVQLSARIRLSLDLEGRPVSWEGNIPYVPQVDFRATGRTVFDPWAWDEVRAAGSTMRVRLADVPLTDAIVRIPGISGGLTFEAQAEVDAGWRSVRFDFGLDADPITRTQSRVLGLFQAGPFVEYQPVLEGVLSYRGAVRVYPGLYVSLAGRRWTLDLFELPIRLGPFPRDIRTAPSVARLSLPDLSVDADVLDFGDVPVGTTAERSISVRNDGEGLGHVLGVVGEGPFAASVGATTLPERSRGTVLATFSPVRPGYAQGFVVVHGDDPDTPRLRVLARGTGIGPARVNPPDDAGSPAEDGGVAEDGGDGLTALGDGGCGCRAAGGGPTKPGGPWGLWALGLAMAAAIGRRRRRR